MRLYVRCPNTDKRVYLHYQTNSRLNMFASFELTCPHDEETHSYKRENIVPEPTPTPYIISVIVFGMIGTLAGGVVGSIIGITIGFIMGFYSEYKEKKKIQFFNARPFEEEKVKA